MKLFLSYLKLHYKSLLLFLMFSSIFAAVFSLYSLPSDAIIYSVFLCFFVGLIILVISFWFFVKRHKTLTEMCENIKISLEQLPEPKNIIEADYEQLVRSAFKEKCRAESEKAIKISEMTEYYTMWVHQIKTPIAAMRLVLQSLPETEENAEIENQLFIIEQYVDMVLNYIKSDYNASDYVFCENDLDSIIKGAVRKYAKQFIRKKITLVYNDIDKKTVTDEKWLSFVIEQILSNAIKYTSEGCISIYLENESVLVIEDTGIGIAAEDLPRVCEKGYTGFNGRADKKSTGIGLYLCRKILSNLSCRLVIQSQVGVGTKVKIEFNDGIERYE